MNASAINAAARVLLVEDHPQLRRILHQALQAEGFQVSVTSGATEAMESLAAGLQADLLLSDIRMPGPIDGLRLARWVRNNHPRMAILLQTGYTDTDHTEFMVLRKPFAPQELVEAIDRALSEQRARNEVRPA